MNAAETPASAMFPSSFPFQHQSSSFPINGMSIIIRELESKIFPVVGDMSDVCERVVCAVSFKAV
jgi:hypothetical protein